jgi:hypothetical protein
VTRPVEGSVNREFSRAPASLDGTVWLRAQWWMGGGMDIRVTKEAAWLERAERDAEYRSGRPQPPKDWWSGRAVGGTL